MVLSKVINEKAELSSYNKNKIAANLNKQTFKQALEEIPPAYNNRKDKIKAKTEYIVKKYNQTIQSRGYTTKATQYRKLMRSYKKGDIDHATIPIINLYYLKDMVKQLRNIKTILNVGGSFITITPYNYKELQKSIQDLLVNTVQHEDSFGNVANEIIENKQVKIQRAFVHGYEDLIFGDFFNYSHNIDGLDLRKYQIYHKDDELDSEFDLPCFIKALKEYGIDNIKLEKIKRYIKMRSIPQKKIKEIAEKYSLYITVKRPEANKNVKHYGNNLHEKIELGLIDKHYFLISQTDVNSFPIKNYEQCKEYDNWKNIIGFRNNGRPEYQNRYIDSYDLIQLLIQYKDNFLQLYSRESLRNTVWINEGIDNREELLTVESRFEDVFEEKIDEYLNVFFDFETYKGENNIHVPYLCRCSETNNTFVGENCGHQMLVFLNRKHPGKNLRLIAHNVSYDFRFLFQYLLIFSTIERGTKLLQCDALFTNGKSKNNIMIRDSYALISMKLSDFPASFQLQDSKEVIPYDLYNAKTVKDRYIDKSQCLVYLKHEYNKKKRSESYEDYENHFLDNCIKWECLNEDKIDILKYSAKYCCYDVSILKEGYNKFKQWINEITGLNVNNFCSIASLAHSYFRKEGCFENVAILSGCVREFIQKCVVGGRTMTRQNKKFIVQEIINDFDAVSLYPSAVCFLNGYLQGHPKVLSQDQLNYEFLQSVDGYFVEIIIDELGIKRDFPLLSYKDENGCRCWSNDVIGKNIYIDKISLEDAIEFQKIKFRIVRGYYFNEGRNIKSSNVMRYLFNARVLKKKEGNKIESVYKLIMNSSYGKTGLKEIQTDSKYISGGINEEGLFDDGVLKYISKNYNFINEIVPLNKYKTKVKLNKTIGYHENYVQCCVEILSYSKRLMNRVMCLAEDNRLKIYYQDTDSMHITDESIPKLSKLFMIKYNKELIGSDIGQFHSDFKSDKLKNCEIKAALCIGLGKKCYVDKLVGYRDNELVKDVNGDVIYDYHIRMKGVGDEVVEYYCDKNNLSIEDLYILLHSGQEAVFDLTCEGNKCSFNFKKNMTIETRTIFERKIKFSRK